MTCPAPTTALLTKSSTSSSEVLPFHCFSVSAMDWLWSMYCNSFIYT